MIPVDLIRWINASINDYFQSNRGSYPLFIEGQDFNPISDGGNAWCELHLSVGPTITETVKNQFEVDLTLTLVCSALPTSTEEDAIHRLSGYFANLASSSFPIKKYGNDDTLLGCMQPIEDVRIIQWGYVQIPSETPLRVKQTHVESSYHFSL